MVLRLNDDLAVQVVTSSESAADVMAPLRAALGHLEDSGAEPRARIGVCAVGDAVRIIPSMSLPAVSVARADVVDEVVRVLTRMVLDLSRLPVHVHAGTVERDGVGVLVLGASRSGKSTLVATAASRGWVVGNDEMAGIDPVGPAAVCWQRPIMLRPASHDPVERSDVSRSVGLPPVLGGAWATRTPLTACVCLARDEAVDSVVMEPLTRSELACHLVENCLDLQRDPHRAFAAVAQLAAAVPGWKAVYAEAADLIDSFLTHEWRTDSPASVAILGPSEGRAWRRRGPRRHPSALTAVLDGRAVIWLPGADHAVRLDPVGSAVWLALDGRRRGHDSFLEELAGLGLMA